MIAPCSRKPRGQLNAPTCQIFHGGVPTYAVNLSANLDRDRPTSRPNSRTVHCAPGPRGAQVARQSGRSVKKPGRPADVFWLDWGKKRLRGIGFGQATPRAEV